MIFEIVLNILSPVARLLMCHLCYTNNIYDRNANIYFWLRSEIILVLDVRSTLRSFSFSVFRHPDFFIGLLLLPSHTLSIV